MFGTTPCFRWCSFPFIYLPLSLVGGGTLFAHEGRTGVDVDRRLYQLSVDTAPRVGATVRVRSCSGNYLVMGVFYKTGHFMSIAQSVRSCQTNRLVLLRVICDSALQRLLLPDEKLAKLEPIIKEALCQGFFPFWYNLKIHQYTYIQQYSPLLD